MNQIKSDSVAVFTAERLVSLSKEDTLKSVVIDAYKIWCNKNGINSKKENTFGKKFKELGFHWARETTDARRNYWEGISMSQSQNHFFSHQ